MVSVPADDNPDADGIQFPIPPNVDKDLFLWWMQQAFSDITATGPKVMEYGGTGEGSADLRIMGDALGELCGLRNAPESVRMELACWFYALGKISRLVSDYKHGQPGKADTWFDLSTYAFMARRLQATGQWP